MDIRPAGSAISQTSAVDALRRVQGSAAAGDSEDSQTAGYMSGGSRGRHQQHADDSEYEESTEFVDDSLNVLVDISAEILAAHLVHPVHDATDPAPEPLQPEDLGNPRDRASHPKQQLDIEA